MITYFIIFLYNVHEGLKNPQLANTKVTECSAQSEADSVQSPSNIKLTNCINQKYSLKIFVNTLI